MTEVIHLPYTTWRYHTDADFREQSIKKTNNYIKERRIRDPAFDQYIKELWKKNSEKYRSDPEKYEKIKEANRERARRRYAEQKEAKKAAEK